MSTVSKSKSTVSKSKIRQWTRPFRHHLTLYLILTVQWIIRLLPMSWVSKGGWICGWMMGGLIEGFVKLTQKENSFSGNFWLHSHRLENLNYALDQTLNSSK